MKIDKDNPKRITGEVTDAQITQWKNQYKEVYRVKVPLEDDKVEPNEKGQPKAVKGECAIGYICNQDMDTWAASTQMQASNLLGSALILYDNCYLGGDPRIDESDVAKLAVIKKIRETFVIREAELEKL